MSKKDKQRKVPTDERKPDTSKNTDSLDQIIERQREREKNRYPVRVSKTTVIYVTKKKKVTKEYAEEYNRDKLMRLRDEKEKKSSSF